jgi:hypothetical protein
MPGNSLAVANLDDERSIREGEAAVERYNSSRDEARAQVLPMARGLCAAKRKHPATQEFGAWLDTSQYATLEKNDRAALIKIGENEEFAIRFLDQTKLVSPQTIWAAMEPMLPTSYHRKSAATSGSPSSGLPPSSHHVNSTSNPPSTTELLGSSRPLPAGVSPAVLYTPGSFSRSAEAGGGFAARAAEFHSIFRNETTRETLERIHHGKHGPAIWGLMTQARDAGLLVENDRSLHTASLWLLCPSLPRAGEYDLENPEYLAQVRDHFLPAMLACRDQILAEPERASEIVNEYIRNKDEHDSGQSTSKRNSTEEDQYIAWINELNAVLWDLMKLDDRFTEKYGNWRRWPTANSADRLRRVVKFLSSLIPDVPGEEK